MQAIFLDRFPFKAGEPQEAVKIALERGEGGVVEVEGWRVTPAPFQTVQQKLAGSAWLNSPHCKVKTMEELILRYGEYVMHWLCAEILPYCAFDEKGLGN